MRTHLLSLMLGLAGLASVIAPPAAQAATITYTLTGIGGSGTINGVAFSGQNFVVTAVGDTATAAVRGFGGPFSFPSVQLTSLTFQIGANPLGVATSPTSIYVVNSTGALGNIAFLSVDFTQALIWSNPGAAIWDVASNFSSATNVYSGGNAVSTNLGPVALANWSAATFTAVVPEPGSVVFLTVGLAGALLGRRRKEIRRIA